MQFDDVIYFSMLCFLSALCIKHEFYRITCFISLCWYLKRNRKDVAQVPTMTNSYKATDVNLLDTQLLTVVWLTLQMSLFFTKRNLCIFNQTLVLFLWYTKDGGKLKQENCIPTFKIFVETYISQRDLRYISL